MKKLKDRVPTGTEGLDNLIEGGFPRGSLILLAGSPGSGKTITSAQYIYHGASRLDENGVYISFGERKEVFEKNMKRLGLNFEKLEKKGKFKFLDLMTVREEAFPGILSMALDEVVSMKAKRLVIDSFSAMSLAFNKKIDARIILHLLQKVMRVHGCTTLMVVEVPTGHSGLGLGFEEFVADGIILFETIGVRSGIRKRAIVRKMRGTEHNQNYSDITISEKGISLRPYVT